MGHSLVNNLGRIGSSVVIPHRGSTERAQGIFIPVNAYSKFTEMAECENCD